MFLLQLFLVFLIRVDGTTYPTPGATFDALSFISWEDSQVVNGSKKGTIFVPLNSETGDSDFISVYRLNLYGDNSLRGFAHGKLMTTEIIEFTGPKLDEYFKNQIFNKDVSQFPQPLQDILLQLEAKGKEAAPTIFRRALAWIWQYELPYITDDMKQEIRSIAEGMCSTLGESCDVSFWENQIQSVNMLPELVRMACTAYGAWGRATYPANSLVQLRSLDFGPGPFANYTVVIVNSGGSGHDFITVGFPAMVGVITGISRRHIGLSQKVWMVDNGDGQGAQFQPGSFDGQPDVFVLRHILEFSESREAAERYMRTAHRTWAIWVGLGDYASQRFDIVAYNQSASVTYTDVTMPGLTGQPYLESVVYVDRHGQPSYEGAAGTLPTALTDFYGNISLETTKIIMKFHGSGDHHIAVYNYRDRQMYLSVGRVNADGYYGPQGGDLDLWKAFNRPYLKFNMDDLFEGKV